MNISISSLSRMVVMISTTAVLGGCNLLVPSESLKATSKALLDASEKCVYEVRDKK